MRRIRTHAFLLCITMILNIAALGASPLGTIAKRDEIEVRLYPSIESTEYVQHFYAEGETVDISKWAIPEMFYEGDPMVFDCWMDEILKNKITENFVMGNKSLAFYATYSDPKISSWAKVEGEDGAYVAERGGVRVIKELGEAQYGTVSADFTNVTKNGGLIFNATLTDDNYPFEKGCAYWYVHVNPSNGKTQLALVDYIDHSYYKSINILELEDSPAAWQKKVAAFGSGVEDSFNLKVEFKRDSISYYIDGDLFYTYTGSYLGALSGTGVGIRAAGFGNVAKNITLAPFVETSNVVRFYDTESSQNYTELTYVFGETVDISAWPIPTYPISGVDAEFLGWVNKVSGEMITDDFVITNDTAVYAAWDVPQLYNWTYDAATGTYTSTGFGVVPLVGIEGTAYGTLSADFVNVSANGGFIFNATLTDVDYPAEAGQQYWYTHINPKSGATQLAYVAATSETTSKYTGVKTVALADSAQSWKDKVAAHNAGTKASYNLKVEFMPDRISYYVDGNLCYTYTGNKLNTLDGTIVGLRAANAGNTVKNVVFTPAGGTDLSTLSLAEGVTLDTMSVSDGYSIIDDKVVYTTEKGVVCNVNTFEAWIKLPSSLTNSEKCGVIFGNASTPESVNFYIEKGGHFAIAWNRDLSTYTFSSVDLRNDTWTHIAFVRDDANEKLYFYVNGELKETIDADIADIAPIAPFMAGVSQAPGAKKNPFKGEIKQITIYSEPQSSDVIALDMANTEITTASRGDDLIANWYFSENWGSLDVVEDTSDNKNNFIYSTYNKYVPVEDFGDYDYAFAVIPDIQIMTNYNPEKLRAQSQWLADNAEKLNIKFAMYLGDLTDYTWTVNCETSERNWDDAKEALEILDGKLPYTFVPGNHDYTNETKTDRDSTLFNEHFPYEKYCTADTFVRAFEEGLMTNTCHLFEVSGAKYLVLCLEFGPRTTVLNWADRMICENKDARVIVTTHSYTDVDGELTESDDSANVKNYNSYENVNTGTEMWEKIFSKHENVFMTFSGHVTSDDIICNVQTGINGNTVRNFLVDLQSSYDYEGKAVDVFMLVKVNETEKTVSYCYYSPKNDMCYNIQNQYAESFADEHNPTVGVPYDENGDGRFTIEDVLVALQECVNNNNSSLLKALKLMKKLAEI